MKKLKYAVLIILLVLLTLFIFRDFFIKTSISTIGQGIIGAPIKIEHFSSSVFNQEITIKNLKIYNPKGFPEGILLDLNEAKVEFKLKDIVTGKLNFPLIVFNLEEVIFVKNKEGKLNVDELKIVKELKGQNGEAPEQKKPEAEKKHEINIDKLKLNIGQVVYEDYTKGEKPEITVIESPIKNKEFENIQSIEDLAFTVLLQSIIPTKIKNADIFSAEKLLNGIDFLPSGVITSIFGENDVMHDFSKSFNEVFEAAQKQLGNMGEIKNANKGTGMIKGKYEGYEVNLKINEIEDKKVRIVVSAKKLFMHNQQIAEDILNRIKQSLN